MIKVGQGRIQVGKQGVTDNFISTLNSMFKTHKNVKVSVLKSGTRDKEKIKEIKNEIIEKLGGNYSGKIIGFTIALKKGRRNKQEVL